MIAIFQSCLLPKMRLSVVREGRFTGYKSLMAPLFRWGKLCIQGGTLFKRGHYRIEKGFDWGHYSWSTFFWLLPSVKRGIS